MNCKEGDLAIIVRSSTCNEGKIVRCLKWIGKIQGLKGGDYWEIDREIPFNHGSTLPYGKDSWMRPIRDQDGEDQMLTITGYPKVRENNEVFN